MCCPPNTCECCKFPSCAYLSFDVLESQADIPADKAQVIKMHASKFARVDRLILYPVILILLTDVFLLLYQVNGFTQDNIGSQQDDVFTGQIFFAVMLSLVVTVVRALIFGRFLLHPTLGLMPTTPKSTGILALVLATLCFIAGVALNMVVAILAIQDYQNTALLIGIFDVLAYILCLVFYRFHIASYIKLLSDYLKGQRNNNGPGEARVPPYAQV